MNRTLVHQIKIENDKAIQYIKDNRQCYRQCQLNQALAQMQNHT